MPTLTLAKGLDPPEDLLDEGTCALLADLELGTRSTRQELLSAREDLAIRLRDGQDLELSSQTSQIRTDDSWQVNPLPAELAVRQVELATPANVDQLRLALPSGADVWVADLEDMLVPTWEQLLSAQRVIGRAVDARDAGKATPVLMVRPRGLHLPEAHLLVENTPISGSVADVGIFLANAAKRLVDAGTAPYLYLPKVETHEEAGWWDRLLTRAEELLGLAPETVRVSVLVETVGAAYQLEEIMHALRRRVTGMAAGRWDYVFSHLRTYGARADHVLPDRDSFTMSTRFLRTYTELLVRTCHRRGAQAIGGPVGLVPAGPFDEETLLAHARVRRDKSWEARQGFDGAWVLHPALVPLARAPFEEAAQSKAGSGTPRPTGAAYVDVEALRDVSTLPGTATLTGLRTNLRAALTYLTGWLDGHGTATIAGHLEDFGTVELARLQTWQWAHHGVRLAEGPTVNARLLERMLADEVKLLTRRTGDAGRVELAAALLRDCLEDEEPMAFLSLAAYDVLLAQEDKLNPPAAPDSPAA